MLALNVLMEKSTVQSMYLEMFVSIMVILFYATETSNLMNFKLEFNT